MLFNSLDFAIFLPLVFLLYWFITKRNLKVQNLLIVMASYLFYGWWDWRFLSLIIFSTIVDFTVSNLIVRTQNLSRKKVLLVTSLLVNLGFLGFFKYYNFFLDNFVEAFSFFGIHFRPSSLRIILPVGISFYTFQTLSYTIDVYRGNLKPTKDLIAFSAFVSFFPQLVAGPIERATNLLPQFYVRRNFDYSQAVDGLRQMLWGFFKKIVIADSCALYANEIFNNYSDYNGSTLFLGTIFFAFQIYGDFSGYSDIAIGISRLFGFNLKRNFAFPYFSRDIAEFWRRWHISLSTWFRDYLYIPLGGSRGGLWMKIRNTFIIFIVSGFWHGANWTFIFWGALNAIFFLPLLLMKRNRVNTDTVAEGRFFPSIKELIQMAATFGLTLLAWVFFRAENLQDAFNYLKKLVAGGLFRIPDYSDSNSLMFEMIIKLLLIGLLVAVEWIQRTKQHALDFEGIRIHSAVRWSIYLSIILIIVGFGALSQQFIYFQF